MKTFIFLSLVAFSFATVVGQTWTQVPTGTDHTINDIFFVNKYIGWFVTHYGLVKKSTDGGLTWFKLDSLSYGAKRIQFLDVNNGYILSGNSYVYKTTNGGISWTPINTNFSVSLEGMDFISTQIGWVVGSSGKILKTTDGGQNWVNQSSISNEIFFDVDFLDENIGSVVGTGGKIYRSYLGGQDWFLQTSGTFNTFSSVFLCNSSYAWLTGYEIRKTSNGGTTWPTVGWISSFTKNAYFLNKDTGWVVTQDGQIGKTTNGQDFTGVAPIPSQNYSTVFFIDINNGWVGGNQGVILKYGTPQQLTVSSPYGGENWQVGSAHNITWTQTNVSSVKIEYSTNNGTSWIQVVSSTPASSGSYSWTVPNTASNRCKVRITDLTDTLISDQSDTTFTISHLFEEVTISNLPAVTHGALAWADYNNDGYLDFLVSGQGNEGNINKIFKNNGNGTFSEQSSFVLSPTASASIDWGDFNNDGYLDILISGYNTDNSDWFTKVYMNDAGVQFIDATQSTLQKSHNGAVRWGDCDNDGDLDILMTGGGSVGEYFAKIYINNGNQGFQDLNLLGMAGVSSSSANWGDYDRDGDLDIILAGYSQEGIVTRIYKNEGNNSFLFQSQISLSGVWQGITNWEDLDNDGSLDILISGKNTEGSAITKIYKNNGDNSFSALATDPGVGLFLSSVQSGDFDNDGHTDLIQSGKDNSEVARTYFLGNNGNLTFTNRPVPMPGLYAGSVAGADFNNDFSLDVLICGENGSASSTKLFKNLNQIANSAPGEPSNLNTTVGSGIVNFSWTPGTDDHTPQGGLSYNIVIGTQPGKYDIVSPSADRTTGFRRISARGRIQSNSWFIKDLQPGTYYWSVQAIDGSFQGSTFATEKSFIVPPQTTGNYSLIFDGVDDYVGDMIEDKITGTTEFTVEAWVKLENFNFAGVITRGSHSGGNWSYNFRLDNARLYWGVYIQEPPNYVTFSPALNDWHHIAGVRTSDGYISLFIDGIKVGSTPCPTTNLFISTPLNFGTYFNDQFGFFKGKLTRIRISKSARYLSNFAPPISYQLDQYTVGQWDFEEGTGSALSDKSTNQINGIIHGATWSTDFPIAQNSLSIVSPNGGENWLVGSAHNITWTQTNVSSVKIEYSTNNGTSWIQVVGSTPASTGSYSWIIPNTISSNCKVKITDVNHSSVIDESNGVFSIVQSLTGNYSLYFDGVNDYIGNILENKISGSSPFTLELWVKNQSSNVAPLINRGSNSGIDWSYNLYVYDSLYFGVNAPLKYIGAGSPSLNTWHHIAAVKSSAGFLKLFIDGNKVSELYYGTGNLTSDFSLQFGKYFADGSSDYFKGFLTRLRISKVDRYSSNFTPPISYIVDANTVGQWDFSEGSGTTLNDHSENNLDGTINGATWSTDFPAIQSSITLTSPNGGENWTVGSTHNITWSQTGVANVKLEYTGNNGTNWYQITASTSATTGSYSWTIPNTVSTNCKVRITDVSNSLITDQSDAIFTISVATSAIYLDYPNGGENWVVGNSYSIRWTQTGVTNVKLEFTTNNGTNWNLIVASTTASTGSYIWTIPNIVSTNCKVRITDVNNNSVTDQSNTVFTISAAPPLTLTSPNGGENWPAISVQNITWVSNGVQNVKLEYTSNNGTSWNQIVASTNASTGSYSWTVPNSISTNCKIRITDVNNSSVTDQSDALFAISAASWTIYLDYPNGGENWVVGNSYSIRWTQTGVTNVKLEFTTNNGTIWNLIVASTPASTGSYSWIIPNTPSTNCRVKITDVSNSSVTDQSSNNFTISAVPSQSVTVTSPNGGENWYVGSTQSITWTHSNDSNIKIEYTTNNGTNWAQIINSTPASSGTYSWTIPNAVANNCRVKITNVMNSQVTDQSNSVFTISPAPIPRVTLSSPNGGEKWFVGAQYSITWNSANIDSLELEYSTNGGTEWILIEESVAATLGSYIWTIPTTPSADCIVRISSDANSAIFDVSDAGFAIAEVPAVTLTSPNGGEKWVSGMQYSIAWSAVAVSKLKAEYSADNGTQWIPVADSVPANLGSYIWTVPNTESNNCLVRLTGVDEPTVSDLSDSPFTIELERNLTLTSPAAGETYTSGQTMSIRWTSLNLETVDIYFSSDNGAYWQPVADSVNASSQLFEWLIPESNSNQVKIRVVYTQRPDLRSEQIGTITILPSPKINLLSNLSAVYLKSGITYRIEWFLENVPSVNLLFSSDGGGVWTQIARDIMPSVRLFDWVIPDLNSRNCRIKIEASNNTTLFSTNDIAFTVYSYSQSVTVSNVWQFGDIKDIGNYRLISIPGKVSGDLGGLMSGKFINDWNAYWDNGNDVDYQIQYNGGSQFTIQPGKGFWVLSKDPISLSNQSEAVTIDSTLLYHVPLHKGWNIIGNVFTKSLNWSDLRVANNLPQSSLLYYWDGKWNFPGMMDPYKGYYFFNPDNRSSLKIIYPVEVSLAKAGLENPVPRKEDGIVVSFGGNEILATFDPASSTGLDTNDYLLPGANFSRKRIAFTREDNGITRQLFIDSQPLDSLGNKFRFSILNETSTPDDLKLSLNIEQKNLNIYLLDEKYSEFIDLRIKNSFKLSPQKGSRYYTLMIGDDSFIRTMKSQYLPTEYLLYQNFPNPFNPETSIKYALPTDGHIKLKLFDILGNEVLTLFEGEESAGVHTRAFNLSGFASGVYFYRLETSGTNLLKKMILMR